MEHKETSTRLDIISVIYINIILSTGMVFTNLSSTISSPKLSNGWQRQKITHTKKIRESDWNYLPLSLKTYIHLSLYFYITNIYFLFTEFTNINMCVCVCMCCVLTIFSWLNPISYIFLYLPTPSISPSTPQPHPFIQHNLQQKLGWGGGIGLTPSILQFPHPHIHKERSREKVWKIE